MRAVTNTQRFLPACLAGLIGLSSAYSQAPPPEKSMYGSKNFFTVDAGIVFNKPTIVKNDFGLTRTASIDLKASFGFLHIEPAYWGRQGGVEFSTQSLRARAADSTIWISNGDVRTTFYFGANYDLVSGKNIGLLLFAGPQLHLHHNIAVPDAGLSPFAGGRRFYNSAIIGYGAYVETKLIIKLRERIYINVGGSYQKGFRVTGKAEVGDRYRHSVLHYTGSGPAVQMGFVFIPPARILSIGD